MPLLVQIIDRLQSVRLTPVRYEVLCLFAVGGRVKRLLSNVHCSPSEI